jgi:uncharacterized protein (DUF302 family)
MKSAYAKRSEIMSDDGLVTLPSRFSARETMERLLAALPARQMTVFAHVDHAANAVAAGMALRPTDLVIFGNPKGGTVLMQHQQRIGLDLPLKALVWEDGEGKVWLSYNDPAWIARRYGIGAAAPVAAMSAAMQGIAEAATR